MTEQEIEKEVSYCAHCETNMAVRNMSGYCDHLYYPANCDVCQLVEDIHLVAGNRIIEGEIYDVAEFIIAKMNKSHVSCNNKIDEINREIEFLRFKITEARELLNELGDKYNGEFDKNMCTYCQCDYSDHDIECKLDKFLQSVETSK